MRQTFACILLLLSLSATFSKYVCIEEEETWYNAQRYCWLFHTDLAPVSNTQDMKQLQHLAGRDRDVWIGLKRNFTDKEKWTWSGGGEVSTFFWAKGQPNNRQAENYGLLFNNTWYDATSDFHLPFLCYSAVVVRERKTWEEALEYCREHHHDLASVASETEMMLIQKELQKNDTAGRVWIGLRFFSGHWLWVDRQPVSYEAWGQEGKPECPEVKMACAALQVMQRSNNTTSTLVTDVVSEAGELFFDHLHGSGVNTVTQNEQNTIGSNMAVGVTDWVAHDCEEKLHFICY